MVELRSNVGRLDYKSLFKSDLRSATATFEGKSIAFTRYGNHLVFKDADGLWKVYLLAGYNQKYVRAYTPRRMLQTSMTPTDNMNALFQPAHLVECQSGWGQADVFVNKLQKKPSVSLALRSTTGLERSRKRLSAVQRPKARRIGRLT